MSESRPWFISYDQGVPEHIVYPRISLVEMLDNSTEKHPDAILTFEDEKPISYKEFSTRCDRLARNLVLAGVKIGDPVALSLVNGWVFILVFFAVLKAGAVVVGINPLLKLEEISLLLEKSQARWLVTAPDLVHFNQFRLEGLSLKGIFHTGSINGNNLPASIVAKIKIMDLIVDQKPSEIKLPHISHEMPAIYQFTGGTTGTPKAAIGSHFNLVANVIQFRNWLVELKDGEETMLAAIPLTHVYGLVLAMCLGIYLGARIICVTNPRDMDLIIRTIEKYKVTVFPAVPNILFGMLSRIRGNDQEPNLASLKVCISGSSPLHPDIQKEFTAKIKGSLIEGYGLSEAPTATHCNPVHGLHKPGSIGLPLPDVDCRVVDLENGSIDVQPGEVGELLIKGPQVMQGYFKNLEETYNVLRNDWLYTGDVVKMDEKGYFYLIDRKKDVIKVSGFQVWPREVEEILSAHPQVKEAAVAGVKDKRQGERVVAWVVPKPQVKLTKEELCLWCREKLSAFKVPSEIEFLEALPRTPVGKVLRRELAAMKKDPG